MLHRHPHGELTQDDTELALQHKLFYDEGRPRGEALLRGTGVNRGHKAAAKQCKYCSKKERRLAGSLPVRIELLVLTCIIPTPERNTGDMRAMVKAGVIEHLHTMYSHLSIHARVQRMQ